MGMCFGKGAKVKVKCKNKEVEISNIMDFTILKMHTQEKLQIGSNFDMFIENKLISNMNSFLPYLERKGTIEIIVKEKQVELIPPPVKPVAVAAKIEVKVHAKVEQFLYTLVDKTESPMFSTLLLYKSHLVVHKRYVPKNPASLFFHTKGCPKEKMDPLKELDDFWLYKLNSDHPYIPRKFCRRFERKGKILGNPTIDLKQDFSTENLYRAPEYLNSNYLGFPIFYRHNLLGFISKVQDDNITIESAYNLVKVLIPSTLKKKGLQDMRQRKPPEIPLQPVKFHPEPPPPDEIELEYHRRKQQETENIFFKAEELSDLEFTANLDIGQSSPEVFSYYYMNGIIIMYSSRIFKPKIVKLELNVNQDEASFTTSPEGLLVAFDRRALLVADNGKFQFKDLDSSHLKHGSVWHAGKWYIVGGSNSVKVEFLEFPLKGTKDEDIWIKAPDLPAPRENFAICSSGDHIYIFGGREGPMLCDSTFRLLARTWENLLWKIPQKLEGIAAIYYNREIIVFGGKGKAMQNKKFFIFDESGAEKARSEIQLTGMFSGKSIGFADDIFSIIVNKNLVLEYHGGFFKVVLTDY